MAGGKRLNTPEIEKRILQAHQLTLGITGSGKTYSVLRPQIEREIINGHGVFIIDPKGDQSFRDAVYSYCLSSDRAKDFHYFSLTNPEISDQLNPFSGITPNEVKDQLIACTDWSEPYYKKVAEAKLLKILIKMESAPTISSLLNAIPEIKELSGLKADLEIFLLGQFGALIDNEIAPGIWDLYQQNKVVFISLDIQAYPQAAVQMGRIFLGMAMGLSNRVQSTMIESQRKRLTIVIDEFGSFITPTFINFLNKARSSNIRLMLATQSISDLRTLGDELVGQIMDNTPVKIIMLLSDPDSIEYASRLIGTQESVKKTWQVESGIASDRNTGRGSSRQVEEFIVHLRDIRKLPVGRGFVLTQAPFSVSFVNFDTCKQSKSPIVSYQPKLKNSEKIKVHKSNNQEIHKVDFLNI